MRWWIVLPAAAAAASAVAVVIKVRKILHTAAFNLSVPSRPKEARLVLENSLQKDSWGKSVYVAKPDGNVLSMVHASRPTSTHLLIYAHGMGGALTTVAENGEFYIQERCKMFLGHGADMLCYDYSGYGASSGERTEESWNRDCALVFQYAEEVLQWPRDKIVPVGQSIGTGVTISHCSTHHGYAGVLLFHPFRSVGSTKSVLLARYLLSAIDLFANETIMHLVQGPVVVVHADSDRTVPYTHGQYLKSILESTGQLHKFVTITGADPSDAHGGIFHVSPFKEQCSSVVGEFLSYLREHAAAAPHSPSPAASTR